MEKTIALKPVLSEKSYALSQTRNTYVFSIPQEANQHAVARAIASQFDVTVENVNILNIAGKAKRTIRKSGRAVSGRQNAVRKAYVTLKVGDSLPIFTALEEDVAEAEKPTKAAEKSEKSDKKNEKSGKGKDK